METYFDYLRAMAPELGARIVETYSCAPITQGRTCCTSELASALAPRQLSEVDAQGARAVQPGSYSLSIGGSQPGDPQVPTPAQTAAFTIHGTQALSH